MLYKHLNIVRKRINYRKIEFHEKEITEALERSGYLLESKIAKQLNSNGFFVETNQVLKDPITGKDREIDLITEYFDNLKKDYTNKCHTKIKFIFEIKNNTAPLILLTEFEDSPNIEAWTGLKERSTIPEGLQYTFDSSYWDKLFGKNQSQVFTQYCSFQKKKGNKELMALHPDNVYSGLSKITQYCEEAIEGREEEIEGIDGYYRKILYLPVFLINDDLYELKLSDENNTKFTKTESSILVYNYHYNGQPKMAYIFVITKKGFPDFMQDMIKLERELESAMIEKRNQ